MIKSMKKKLGYVLRAGIHFFIKTAAVVLFCAVFSLVFVYPLWLFAVKKPDIFSTTVLAFFGLLIGTVLFFKIRTHKRR